MSRPPRHTAAAQEASSPRQSFSCTLAEGTRIRGREPQRRPCAYGFQVIDEPFWIDSSVADEWAIQRNKRWAVFLLHQRESQLEKVSPGLADLMRSVAKLQGRFRPDAMEDAIELSYLVRQFRPDGLQIPYVTTSTSETTTLSNGLTESWNRTISESESFGESRSDGSSASWGDDTRQGQRVNPEDYLPTSYDSGTSSHAGGGQSSQEGTSRETGHGSADGKGGSTTRTTGTGSSKTWNHLVHRISIEEQARSFAQELLRTPDYTEFLSYRGKTRRVRLLPQREYPGVLYGVDIAELAREFQQLVYGERRKERPAFDTSISVVSGLPASSTPPPPPAAPAAEDASDTPSSPEPTPPASSTPPTVLSVPEESGGTPTPADPTLTVDGPDGTRIRLGSRDSAILAAAADWRFLTLDHLRLDAVTFGGYSGITDRVKLLAEAGLLGKMQPPAPRGTGSNPMRYVLTRSGAQALAALSGRDEDRLIQIAENGARTVAQVERLELGQLGHLLAIADVLASASAGIHTVPGITIVATRFDKEVVLDVPVAGLAAHLSPALRRRLSLSDGDQTMKLRPDALIVLSMPTSTGQRTHLPLLVEVETGRKETSFEELGEAMALRAVAAVQSGVITEAVGRLGLAPVSQARILSVAFATPLEERLASGAARTAALGMQPDAILKFTSMDRACPKAPPVSRAARAATLASLASSFVSAIWRTPLDPTRRGLLDG